MTYSPAKTAGKVVKEGVSVTVAAAVVIQLVLEQVMGVEVPTEKIVQVSGAIGVVSGAVRGFFNWLKNRKKAQLAKFVFRPQMIL